MLAFLNTELEVLPDGAPTSGGTQPQQLYQIYVSWARMTGAERPLRCRKFWSRLKELGHESTKSTGTRFFRLRKKQA